MILYNYLNINNYLQKLNEMIAHLKDQLQEMKAKTGLEAKYVKKEAQVIYLVRLYPSSHLLSLKLSSYIYAWIVRM